MVTDEERLVAAIHTHPDDEKAWLAYSDWLDTRGDLRGQFLRALVEYDSLAEQLRLRSENTEDFDLAWWSDPPAEVITLRERIQELAPRIDLFWLVKLHRGWMDGCTASIEDCPTFSRHCWNDTESHSGFSPSMERWCGRCLKYVWYAFSVADLDHQIWPRVDQEIWPKHPEVWHSE